MKRILFIGVLIGVLAWTNCGLAEPGENPVLVLDAGGHTAFVRKILFTRDGKEVITVSDDKTIRFWDAATGDPLRVLRTPIGKGPEGMLYAAALSPDGKTLAVGGYGQKEAYGAIYLIDLGTQRIERVLTEHSSVILSLDFSRDGRHLVSGSWDNMARVWDVASGKCLHVFEGHEKAVHDVALSPDGRRVLTGSFDRTALVGLWRTAAARPYCGDTRRRSFAWPGAGRGYACQR